MLPKKNRLTTNDLKNVGRFSLHRGVYFDAKKADKFTNKYTVIISSKTFKKAVDRNEVKRFFYRILQEEVFPSQAEYDTHGVLFYPKKQTLTADKNLIQSEVFSYLKKK